MKRSILFFKIAAAIVFLSSSTGFGQTITTPRTASPAASVSQSIGISTITIDYSRPAVRDRVIWGDIVPYGWNVQGFGAGNPAPWRAGANENTVITTSHDATVEGKKLPAGSYGLFYVINEDNTGEIVLSKDHRSWGSYWYDPANDVLRAPIEIRDVAHTELLTYDFINHDKNSAELVLNWGKKQFPAKIEFDVDAIVLANAKEELKNTAGFTWQGYNSAAMYALQNEVELEQGLEWANQAVATSGNFTAVSTKAGILEKMGKAEEAEKLVKDAFSFAKEAEVNTYGYQLMGRGAIDRAIEVFMFNTETYPESANAWDSLGEAYANNGMDIKAIACFKKSLSLNPPPNVRANSEKHLKRLEGE